jgi:beta-aspartyl-peptidase (threonine type)
MVRLGLIVCVLALTGCQAQQTQKTAPKQPAWSIAIHGGAGVIERGQMPAEMETKYRTALTTALDAGAAVLEGGGAALDAVEATAKILEDEPLFNAGRGAVFTANGRNELDASIMDGRTRAAGAVAGLTRTRHPISAARKVMEQSGHVLLSGAGADQFAAEAGLEQVEPAFFFTEHRWRQLEKRLTERGLPIPARPPGAPREAAPTIPSNTPDELNKRGTIGVVAVDTQGNYAAGTSTGGMTAKRFGRVGDSPIIGAGTYAMNQVCAISATGAGEYFIRLSVARSICALIELKGMSAQQAADQVVQTDLTAMGGDGGVIVIGPRREVVFSFNTTGMYRARRTSDAAAEVSIFKD